MKKVLSFLILSASLSMALFASGCNKSGGGSSTMNDTCFVSEVQGYGSTNCTYNYAATSGYHSYSTNSQYTAFGTSGGSCTSYQSPVYSDSKGLGCVDNTYVSASGTPAIYVLMGSIFVLGNSATSYQPTITGSASVFRACDSGDSCPSGETCRSATGVATTTGLGLCYF